jgi:hypothetical protein
MRLTEVVGDMHYFAFEHEFNEVRGKIELGKNGRR